MVISNYHKFRLINRADYNRDTGCLEWNGSIGSHGYPRTTVIINGAKTEGKIHRLLLAKKLGRELYSDEYACHRCNNKTCISTAIDHIYLGNAYSNWFDRHVSLVEKL